MKSKLVYLLVVPMVVVGLLVGAAGCAQPAPAPTPAPAPAPKPAPAPAPKPAPTPAPAPKAEVIKWKMQTHLPPEHSQYAAMTRMVNKIKLASGGRLEIELFPGGALIPVTEMFDGISKGVIQYSRAWPGYYSGLEPSFLIFSGLPYGLKTMEENLYLFRELGWQDLLGEVTAKHGVRTVTLGLAVPYGELSSKVPIRKADDFNGLKIRGYGLYNRIFEAFGAVGVSMAAGEIYTGLATGTIDANIWGTPKLHWDLKLHEVAKYWITPPMASFITNMDMVNPDAWAALPDDIKPIIEMASYETLTEYPIFTTGEDAAALADMVNNWGVEVITIPPEETAKMQAVAMDLWDEVAQKDDFSARSVDIIKDFMKLKGYIK